MLSIGDTGIQERDKAEMTLVEQTVISFIKWSLNKSVTTNSHLRSERQKQKHCGHNEYRGRRVTSQGLAMGAGKPMRKFYLS